MAPGSKIEKSPTALYGLLKQARALLDKNGFSSDERLILGSVIEAIDMALESLRALHDKGIEPRGADDPVLGEYFRALSESSTDGMVLHENGKVIYVNDRMLELSGFTRAEAIGESVLTFVAPECHEELRKNVFSGSESPMRLFAFKRDGSRYAVEAMGKSIPKANGILRLTVIRPVS